LRDLFAWRFAGRCTTDASSDVVLGHGWAARGFSANVIDPTNQGEGFLIGGWVAMWRPLEVFLYDWWPIRAEGRLLKRLSTMPVRIEYKETAHSDA